jgi:hypothetical protein
MPFSVNQKPSRATKDIRRQVERPQLLSLIGVRLLMRSKISAIIGVIAIRRKSFCIADRNRPNPTERIVGELHGIISRHHTGRLVLQTKPIAGPSCYIPNPP